MSETENKPESNEAPKTSHGGTAKATSSGKAAGSKTEGKGRGKGGGKKEPAAEGPKRERDPGAGQAMALLALLVAGATAGGGYYLWQQQQQHRDWVEQQLGTTQSVEAQLTPLRDQLKTTDQRLNTLSGALQASEQKSAQARQQLSAAQQALQAELSRLSAQQAAQPAVRPEPQPPVQAAPRVDLSAREAEFLLRQANHLLQLGGDLRSSVTALELASDLLRESDDPALLPVLAAIAAEREALLQLRDSREQPLLELTGLIAQLDTLPLANTGQHSDADTPPPTTGNETADGILARLRGIVEIRRRDERIQPLLAPQEEYFLRQNLRLKLESARLALLQGHAALYRDSLAEAQDWLERYFAPQDPATLRVTEAVTALAAIDPAAPPPDISASLKLLRQHNRATETGE